MRTGEKRIIFVLFTLLYCLGCETNNNITGGASPSAVSSVISTTGTSSGITTEKDEDTAEEKTIIFNNRAGNMRVQLHPNNLVNPINSINRAADGLVEKKEEKEIVADEVIDGSDVSPADEPLVDDVIDAEPESPDNGGGGGGSNGDTGGDNGDEPPTPDIIGVDVPTPQNPTVTAHRNNGGGGGGEDDVPSVDEVIE